MPFTLDPATNGKRWGQSEAIKGTESTSASGSIYRDKDVIEALERRGWTVDAERQQVLDEHGHRVPPATVAQVMRHVRDGDVLSDSKSAATKAAEPFTPAQVSSNIDRGFPPGAVALPNCEVTHVGRPGSSSDFAAQFTRPFLAGAGHAAPSPASPGGTNSPPPAA